MHINFVVYIGVRFISNLSGYVFHEYMEKLAITLGHDIHVGHRMSFQY